MYRDVRYTIGTPSAADTLTADYADTVGTGVNVENTAKVSILVDYTMGADETSNSIQLAVEVADPDVASRDGADGYVPASADWRRLTNEAVSAGTTTVTLREYTFSATVAAGTYDHFTIDLDAEKDGRHQWYRVKAKETGIAANGGSIIVRIAKLEDC